jgi:preprotein translocase subunit Sec61beta
MEIILPKNKVERNNKVSFTQAGMIKIYNREEVNSISLIMVHLINKIVGKDL